MPARSKAQYKFFKYLQENPEEADKKGVSPEVAKEYTSGMTKKRFAKLKQKITK